MIKITADDAQNKLADLIDQTTLSHVPVHVIGRQRNAILIAEADWQLIRQILQMNSTSAVLSDSSRQKEHQNDAPVAVLA
jgi:antitoxin YefM